MNIPILPVFLSALVLGPWIAAAEVQWEPVIYPANQIFPSLIIGAAVVKAPEDAFPSWGDNHLGDPQGVIGIWARGVEPGSEIEVNLEENDYMKSVSFVATVGEGDDQFMAHPKISYKYGALARVKQAVPLDVTMELKVDGKSLGAQTVTATVRTVNDCLFGVTEDNEERSYSDYSWLFAAYVNEDHPWVDRTLKEALATKIVSSFDGFQSGDPEQVLKQIFAVWNVMQRKGLNYSNVTTTAAASESVHSQHVRLFDESVEAAQANCVDGSVLLAAVLRKIGLDPCLVTVPGHMFLAVSLDDETMIGLETTMMGAADLDEVDAKRLRSFLKFDPEERKNEESWATFESAVDTGTAALLEAVEKIDAGDPDYQLIDLAEARGLGILPISSGTAPR
jgi:hypothetical protein